MLTGLSAEQEALQAVVRDEWIALALGGDNALDEREATAGVRWLYELSGLPPPAEVRCLDSPLACCLAARTLGVAVETTAYIGLGNDSGWTAFHSYFHRIGAVSHDTFQRFERFLRSGVWDCVLLSDIALLSRRPVRVTKDAEGRLHSASGLAVGFADGSGVYAWHGTMVPAEWITKTRGVDPALAMTWTNIEQRRALCEILGWDLVLASVPHRVIDADEDPEIGTLIEATIDDEPARFLRVVCGTGRQFCLSVPLEMQTALQANAWSYELDGEKYSPEVRT